MVLIFFFYLKSILINTISKFDQGERKKWQEDVTRVNIQW